MPWEYRNIMRATNDKKIFRYQLVVHAQAHGNKPAARHFGVDVKTVRKWRRRYEKEGYQGLEDRSRAPKNPHNTVSQYRREKTIALKKKFKKFGAERLRRDYGLPVSPPTARKIWREEGLLKRRRRKHKTKQNLREIKKQWRLFEQVCIDTKDLDDIPELYPGIQAGILPKIQYTAREVVSGMHFVAYADERSLNYATDFAEMLIAHFEACGVNLEGTRFQTDNGSEFIGSWNAKEDSAFTKTVQCTGQITHKTIPPGAHTWQSDVETAHNLIEFEHYEVHPFRSRTDFIEQTQAYNAWFNIQRTNSYKENRTPWQIAQERDGQLDPLLPLLPPVYLEKKYQRGEDVVAYP